MQDWAIGVVNGPVGAHILPKICPQSQTSPVISSDQLALPGRVFGGTACGGGLEGLEPDLIAVLQSLRSGNDRSSHDSLNGCETIRTTAGSRSSRRNRSCSRPDSSNTWSPFVMQ